MNYLQVEKIISKTYLNALDVSVICGISISQARKHIKAVENEMKQKGLILPKRANVPTERILKRLGLSIELIHREAEIERRKSNETI